MTDLTDTIAEAIAIAIIEFWVGANDETDRYTAMRKTGQAVLAAINADPRERAKELVYQAVMNAPIGTTELVGIGDERFSAACDLVSYLAALGRVEKP